MNGMRRAFETKPGTSFDVVTTGQSDHEFKFTREKFECGPLPQAVANDRALARVCSEVCRAEISSTNV